VFPNGTDQEGVWLGFGMLAEPDEWCGQSGPGELATCELVTMIPNWPLWKGRGENKWFVFVFEDAKAIASRS